MSCVLPEGAFYAFASLRGLVGREFDGLRPQSTLELAGVILEKANVAFVPGEAFKVGQKRHDMRDILMFRAFRLSLSA